MPVYNLTASQCPAIRAPALLDPALLTPVFAQALANGDTTALFSKFNRNAVSLDLAHRLGGGGDGVALGLELSISSGLTVAVSAGQASIDGPATLAAASTVSASEGYVSVWISQSGVPVAVSGSITSPTGTHAYLGRVLASGGAITGIDYSGRMALRGGTLYRRTADVGVPGDTPPSTVQFMHQTQTGLYWWTGSAYKLLTPYDIAGYTVGAVSPGAEILRFLAPRPFTLPAGLVGSVGHAGTAATTGTHFSVQKNGAPVGSMTFAVGESQATFAAASAVSFAAGDRLSVFCGPYADASLADLCWTLVGVL